MSKKLDAYEIAYYAVRGTNRDPVKDVAEVEKMIENYAEAKDGQHETIVMQHKEIKKLVYDAVAFLEQLEKEGEFKFWGDGYNRQVLDEIKSNAKKLGVA